MKCTCSRSDLNDALNAVSRAVAVKPATPILGGIYLRAENNTLELQSTNYQLGVIARIPANVENEGATVVIGKYFPSIVQKFSGEIVTISDENDSSNATLKSEAASFDLLTMDADDFPRVKKKEILQSFRVQSGALKNLISHAAFACGNDQSRPAFTGCLAEISGTNINFVGTNAHRIAIAKDKIFDETPDFKLIIPATTLRNLLGMLAGVKDSVVTVDYSGSDVAFTFENVFVSSRLIDAAFPSYEKVIPASCETTAVVEVAELRAALERMQIIASETEYKTVMLNFTQDGLEIISNSYEIGKSTEHVDAEVTGSDIELAFNVNYLQDALKIIGSSKLKIGMNQTLSPVDIRGLDDDSFIYIITPLRTQ